MRIYLLPALLIITNVLTAQTFNNHQVILDEQQKIISWIAPQSEAYHRFLEQRWNFIKHHVPNAPNSTYPQYYFYCAYKLNNGNLEPDTWMNDVGEKIPNWFESARLYYAYSGDTSVMEIAKGLADYALEHGTSPANFSWPNFPYTTTNAGDTIFRGFTSANRFVEHEIQVDHAGEMGLTYYRLYQYTKNEKYRKAAINVANTLASKVRTGTAIQSPWPYLVIVSTGKVTAEYGANFLGCYQLLDALQKDGIGNPAKYRAAMEKVRSFTINFPMKTGYWTDGHTDNAINSHTYKSNMSASNAKLFMFDHPEFNPAWKTDMPRLIKWTEKYFIERSAPGEPANQWGANIVGEQDSFMYKMDYQTARYAAECARWYAISGDEAYREKAYRSLNWVTYCNDEKGLAFESPLSKGINSWWSDCYGEGPRMFYHAFAAIPEWAPPAQNHILYSTGVLKDVIYAGNKVEYYACDKNGKEYIKLKFQPEKILLDDQPIAADIRKLKNGDYYIIISRKKAGRIFLSSTATRSNIIVDPSVKYQVVHGIGVNANTRSWNNDELKPALNLLIDSMRANIWRVIVETVEKWEDQNDNNDPFTFNWKYYDALYETPKFRKAWDMIAYLNSRGITDNLMINFMGPVPEWMGKKTVKPELQDEYIEMITSFFWYARNKKKLKFGLVSPTNESDWRNEGPELNEFEYARLMRKLVDRMSTLGMGDIKYVGPDPANMKEGVRRYIPELMKDSVIMQKLAHIGVHSYGGYYAPLDSVIKHSDYPASTWWVTEWNAWRDGLDDGKIGVYDFNFARQCVGYLLDLFKNGASGAMEWEGYDSYYEHHYPSLFSYWGILGYDSVKKMYSPRKHLYAIRQVSQYLAPGSRRVELSGGDNLNIVAFVDSSINTLTVIGVNDKNYSNDINLALPGFSIIGSPNLYITDSIRNIQSFNVTSRDDTIKTHLPSNSIFTITARIKRLKPQPAGWYSGDIHVHRNCGSDSILPENKLSDMMNENDLDVISVLADMGNGEVKDAPTDLKKINGTDITINSRIIHWDAEWHWDATYSNFEHQALGGHLVVLGLKNAQQIWEESPYKVLQWAKKQGAVTGFCHMQYLNDSIQNDLNCCIPVDYPVEAALGNIDFISEDVYGRNSPNNGSYNSEAAMNAYYKLLNCGFRLGLAAGTDYPCNGNEPLGKLLTYVNVNGDLSYTKWINGIKKGNTVVSRNGGNEFIELKIDGKYQPGNELKLSGTKPLTIEVKWTSSVPYNGTIELISNGRVIATHAGSVSPGNPVILRAKHTISKSSWICARRMENGEHQVHTAPVYIQLNNQPIRTNADDALYFVKWIENILTNIDNGGRWSKYFTKDIDSVKLHYNRALGIYKKIASEAENLVKHPVLILASGENYSAYAGEILKTEGINEFIIKPLDQLEKGSDHAVLSLSNYDLIILPHTSLTQIQSNILQQYVKTGGNLIAFRPDKKLAAIFGLQASNESINESYFTIQNNTSIGRGLIRKSLRFHGSADIYKTTTSSTIASLKNGAPAVVLNKFGNGQALAFTYDLPMSIAFTRQGNFKNAGQEKDGITGIRAMDLFTDGWVDTANNIFNQADEQMRLLAHCIESLNADKKPLPRFWYFPGELKSLVTLTNDGEDSEEKDIDPQLKDIESKGANMSLYILEADKISKSSTDDWHKRGNEMSGHPDNTQNAEHPTWQNMNDAISYKLNELKNRYAIPKMRTVVNHWFVWCGNNEKGEPDYTAQAQIERNHGIEMDINYAHYDNGSNQGHFLGSLGTTQGNYTGSGMPMKFANQSGNVIDIYQHFNNVYDQQYMENKDSAGFFNCFKGLLDRSLNEEVYSYISVKAHNNEYFFSKGPLLNMLDYAKHHNVPVWTPVKLLDFLKTRDEASFQNIRWTNNSLKFTLQSSIKNENGLSFIIPYTHKGKNISRITINGSTKDFNIWKIKGNSYAFITISPGKDYEVEAEYRESSIVNRE